jgi:hypothetical protein
MTLSHSFLSTSSVAFPLPPMPALFTATSILPNALTVSASPFLTDSSLLTSVARVMISSLGNRDFSSSRVVEREGTLRPEIARRVMPYAAREYAVCCPIPGVVS